jgi:hypothetical protein
VATAAFMSSTERVLANESSMSAIGAQV